MSRRTDLFGDERLVYVGIDLDEPFANALNEACDALDVLPNEFVADAVRYFLDIPTIDIDFRAPIRWEPRT